MSPAFFVINDGGRKSLPMRDQRGLCLVEVKPEPDLHLSTKLRLFIMIKTIFDLQLQHRLLI